MKFKKIDAKNFGKKDRRQCKICFKQLTRDDIKHHRRIHADCIDWAHKWT